MASLTVVMLLFFVMALTAAYSSRNMIFEQRTTTNQVRSMQAIEAAQAGMDWAISLLNSGRLTAACLPSADTSETSFRDRYLTINTTTAFVTAKLTSANGTLMPTCVADGAGWRCNCPVDSAPSLSASTAATVAPAFRVRFTNVVEKPWTTRVEVNGCTKLDDSCLDFPSAAASQEGRAGLVALVTLRTALSTMPGAAVTSRGDVSGDLIAYNNDASVNGITVQSGGDVNVDDSRLRSLAGVPGRQSRYRNDASFADAALPGSPKAIGDRFFASFFGLWPEHYRDQPSAITMDCSSGCNDSTLRSLISLNPGRLIWVNGDLSINSGADIGSAASPVMIVMSGGSLTFTVPATIYGLVYGGRSSAVTPPAFEISGPGTVRGAVISEHELQADNDVTIVFDKAVNTLIRLLRGSFVLVPGSWKDF